MGREYVRIMDASEIPHEVEHSIHIGNEREIPSHPKGNQNLFEAM